MITFRERSPATIASEARSVIDRDHTMPCINQTTLQLVLRAMWVDRHLAQTRFRKASRSVSLRLNCCFPLQRDLNRDSGIDANDNVRTKVANKLLGCAREAAPARRLHKRKSHDPNCCRILPDLPDWRPIRGLGISNERCLINMDLPFL